MLNMQIEANGPIYNMESRKRDFESRAWRMKEKVNLCDKWGTHTQEHMSKSESSKLACVIFEFCVQTCKLKLTDHGIIWNNKIGILKLRTRHMKEKGNLCHKWGRQTNQNLRMISDFYVHTCKSKLLEQTMIWNWHLILKIAAWGMKKNENLCHGACYHMQ